jgi:hypothetical protein
MRGLPPKGKPTIRKLRAFCETQQALSKECRAESPALQVAVAYLEAKLQFARVLFGVGVAGEDGEGAVDLFG